MCHKNRLKYQLKVSDNGITFTLIIINRNCSGFLTSILPARAQCSIQGHSRKILNMKNCFGVQWKDEDV